MQRRRLPYHIRLLQTEMKRRKTKNPRYSLRAFARFLDIDPSALSRVLAMKQDLSLEACKGILEKLELPPLQARLFVAAVAEDKRNRASAILTRAIEPLFSRAEDFDPRFEQIVSAENGVAIQAHDVLAYTKDLIAIVDLEGRFIFANEAMAHSLDSIPCELIGQTWQDTKYPKDVSDELDRQQKAAATAIEETRFEFSIGQGRATRHYERKLMPLFGHEREFKALLSTIRDITWRRFLRETVLLMHSSIDCAETLVNIARGPTPLFSDLCLVGFETKKSGFDWAALGFGHESASEKDRAAIRSAAPWLMELAWPAKPEARAYNFTLDQAREIALSRVVKVQAILVAPMKRGALVFLSESRLFNVDDVALGADLAAHAERALENALSCD